VLLAFHAMRLMLIDARTSRKLLGNVWGVRARSAARRGLRSTFGARGLSVGRRAARAVARARARVGRTR
jgi:hypothetical protein